jgi:hypothetical protein
MSDTSLLCITCDRSPQWANHGQCFGCLLDHSKPCDYVPKFATHTDLAVAVAEICQYRATWEAMHPLWELVPDMERLWPESAAPSHHADYATTIGRKLVHARWKVERRHPRGHPWARRRVIVVDSARFDPLLWDAVTSEPGRIIRVPWKEAIGVRTHARE